MMTNNIDSNELREMKAQLELLTKKLEQETIVNERLIRRSMKEKANKLRRQLVLESLVCILMIPFFLWVLPRISPISMHFCLFSVAFFALAIGYNYYMYRQFPLKDFMEGSLVEVRKATLKFKRLTLRWTYGIGIPFLLVYVPWFVYEKFQVYQGELLHAVLIGGAIGFLVGGSIGIYQFRKTLRTTDELLQQIEELEEQV